MATTWVQIAPIWLFPGCLHTPSFRDLDVVVVIIVLATVRRDGGFSVCRCPASAELFHFRFPNHELPLPLPFAHGLVRWIGGEGQVVEHGRVDCSRSHDDLVGRRCLRLLHGPLALITRLKLCPRILKPYSGEHGDAPFSGCIFSTVFIPRDSPGSARLPRGGPLDQKNGTPPLPARKERDTTTSCPQRTGHHYSRPV